MRFDDDFVVIHFQSGSKQYFCKELGLDWPPPPKISVLGFEFELRNHSHITDNERAKLTKVCRGAEYILCDRQTVEIPPSNRWN